MADSNISQSEIDRLMAAVAAGAGEDVDGRVVVEAEGEKVIANL